MGRPKALLPWDGGTVVEAVLAALSGGGVGRTVLVVAAGDRELAERARGRGVEVAENPDPSRGMLSSVLAGVEALGGAGRLAAAGATLLVTPADLPGLSATSVAAVLAAVAGGAELAVPVHGGRRGHPLAVGAACLGELAGLDPAVGLRQLLARHPRRVTEVPVADPGAVTDVDTPGDYESLAASGILSAMSDWDFSPPPPSPLGDREVPRAGRHLEGRRVALMVTGGIAAMKAPFIARALRRQGAEVVAYASDEGLRYVAVEALEWSCGSPVVRRLTAAAEHLADARPFDAYLVAPATYNTLNKLAAGIADGPVTAALASALGRCERGETAVLVAPTMHGSLHNAILTASLRRLDGLGVRVVPPREDYGKHNIPSEEVLVAEVCRAVSRSPLRGVRILVTGGPTPVPIDSVRRITNRFRGRLGAEITAELHLRGAAVRLIHGDGAYQPPEHLPVRVVRTFDEYRDAVLEELAARPTACGIFSAAVADYRPREVLAGKTPSGGALERIELVPTEKVIRRVRSSHPDLYLVSFKYQEGVDHDALLRVGRERLAELGGPGALVANRGEETGPGGEQVAWLVTGPEEARRAVGKDAIAILLADHLEEVAARGALRPVPVAAG